jgi:hypothetical protein
LLIGIFGFFGVISGAKLAAGALGALWGYLAAVGAYELNRRKFGWVRGARYADRHLFAGTVAASAGLILSGAMYETMPGLALLPATSAIVQANDGHKRNYRAFIHAAVLATGIAIGSWFYADGVIGKVLLERIEALP